MEILNDAEQLAFSQRLGGLAEIVHSGSFSAAAATLGRRLHLSPGGSKSLKHAGNNAANRSARGVALDPEVATVTTTMCWKSSTQYQRLVDDVTQIKTRPEGMIRIGWQVLVLGAAILR
ncbi:hypothetical protein ACNKHV_19340 [Shigella flexneri]